MNKFYLFFTTLLLTNIFSNAQKFSTKQSIYTIADNLRNNTVYMDCPETDTLKIAYMGSSVAYGTGATNNQGYNYLYTQILEDRYTAGIGLDWNTANISVPGNNTISLSARLESDLYPLCAKYVIFGLSMGNEGIHESSDKQAIFDQFKNNMLALIDSARSRGIIPVVANNYTRNDFTDTDYEYIKKMDLLIHQWDVPSINLLGAIDDGEGHWATGYWNDNAHPNSVGHREFSYAMIPSLFDALAAGKTLPERASGNYMNFENGNTATQLVYTPDNTVHSFTVSFDFKTNESGVLSTFKYMSKTGILKINEDGYLVYNSPFTKSGSLNSSTSVTDNQWHKITLTNFFAREETDLYIDSTFVGTISEKMVPKTFYLNDIEGPANVSFRDWFFYRSGMNADEIKALCDGKMLKSSLELYAPLWENQAQDEQLTNIAQSMTTVSKQIQSLAGIKQAQQTDSIKVYPNPVQNTLKVTGYDQNKSYQYSIYNIAGQILMQDNFIDNKINISELASDKYILVLRDNNNSDTRTTMSFNKQ